MDPAAVPFFQSPLHAARAHAARVGPGQYVRVEPDGHAVGMQLRPLLREQLEARLHGVELLEVELQVVAALDEAALEKVGKGEVDVRGQLRRAIA